TCFLEGHPDVVRLFPDFLQMEEEYYARTKVWPIMHIIAMRRAILDEHPWAARNLYNAFLESKRRSIERILDPAASRYPVPWLAPARREHRLRSRPPGATRACRVSGRTTTGRRGSAPPRARTRRRSPTKGASTWGPSARRGCGDVCASRSARNVASPAPTPPC